MEQARLETVRRTFNINNFESLTIEGTSAHPDPRAAHLIAQIDCLKKAQISMVRIFNVRKQYNNGNEFDELTYSVVTTEIQGLDFELSNLRL